MPKIRGRQIFSIVSLTHGKENSPPPATKLMKRELQTLFSQVTGPTCQDDVRKQTHQKLLPMNIGDYVHLYDGKTPKKGEGNQEMWSTLVISHPKRE